LFYTSDLAEPKAKEVDTNLALEDGTSNTSNSNRPKGSLALTSSKQEEQSKCLEYAEPSGSNQVANGVEGGRIENNTDSVSPTTPTMSTMSTRVDPQVANGGEVARIENNTDSVSPTTPTMPTRVDPQVDNVNQTSANDIRELSTISTIEELNRRFYVDYPKMGARLHKTFSISQLHFAWFKGNYNSFFYEIIDMALTEPFNSKSLKDLNNNSLIYSYLKKVHVHEFDVHVQETLKPIKGRFNILVENWVKNAPFNSLKRSIKNIDNVDPNSILNSRTTIDQFFVSVSKQALKTEPERFNNVDTRITYLKDYINNFLEIPTNVSQPKPKWVAYCTSCHPNTLMGFISDIWSVEPELKQEEKVLEFTNNVVYKLHKTYTLEFSSKSSSNLLSLKK
jgi:hypothetical protein